MNKFDESRRRKHRVTLRLDDEEYKLLCEWSAAARRTMSDYLRELIHHTQPAEFPPLEYNEVLRELRRIGINMNHIALRSNTHGFADEREFRAEVDRLWRVVAEFSQVISRGGIKFGSEKDMGIQA